MSPAGEGVIVWDCGATNTTVSILGTDGSILSSRSQPTEVVRTEDGLAWPLEEMWAAFCGLSQEVVAEAGVELRAVSVTTFGVCWGAVDERNRLIYPVISWKCPRSREQRDWADAHLDMDEAYRTTGAPPFHFNSAFTLRWVREHRPEVLDDAAAILLMPQLFVARLAGVRAVERSMATTTMLYDLAEDDWSSELMDAFDVPSKFPEPVLDPGAVVGSVTQEAAAASGVAQGTPVCAGGHDTVIAAAGACRDLRETLLYSTGTWNIFIATRDHLGVRASDRRRNVLWQLNPHRSGVLGGYNVQGHMIGGLAFDMVRRMFLPNESAAGATERATHVPPGSHGVAMNPTFVAGTGPNPNAPSAILGWEDGLAPECAVRSVLEGLAFQARDSMECLRSDAEAILVGGGFAKNRLFAQILADVTGRAVELAGIPEVTTLGAAVLAMVGASVVDSVEEAWTRIGTPVTTFEPSGADTYAPLYEQHRRSVEALDREGS